MAGSKHWSDASAKYLQLAFLANLIIIVVLIGIMLAAIVQVVSFSRHTSLDGVVQNVTLSEGSVGYANLLVELDDGRMVRFTLPSAADLDVQRGRAYRFHYYGSHHLYRVEPQESPHGR